MPSPLQFLATVDMKILVQTLLGETLDIDGDLSTPISELKAHLASLKPELGSADSMRFAWDGRELVDGRVSLNDACAFQFKAGDLLVMIDPLAAAPESGFMSSGGPKVPITGRPGEIPSTGFQAVTIEVSKCTNEKTNGLYVPSQPHADKPAWYKAPSEEEMDVEGSSKDRGERIIYFRAKEEKWFIGDELDKGGFTYVPASGQCPMPPISGWANGFLELRSVVADGDLNVPDAMTGLTKLQDVTPWADQETCYVTMMKVLGNIASNPGEAKFCSLKIENAAIQNKILRHDGARGFFEAVGFRENAGALVLPTERGAQAKVAQELLQGFANDAYYVSIRKERSAKAAEEMKKDKARPKARTMGKDKEEAGGGPRFGQDRMGGKGG